MSLKAELDAFRSECMAHVPPKVRDALAYVDVDYRNRLAPAEILTALQSMSKEHKGEHHANTSR